LGRRFQQPGIDAFYEGTLVSLRLLQGRLNDSVDRLEDAVGAFPAFPTFRFALVVALSDAGRREEARTIFERLVATGSVALPQDHLVVYNIAILAAACLRLDAIELASALYEMLLPYGPYNVRQTRIGSGCIGSVQHYLGLLATTTGRWDDAVNHLEAAVAANTRQGFLPAAVHSRHHLGRALARRGREGDHHRGRTLTAEARLTAVRHGIQLTPDAGQSGKMSGANHPLSSRELQVAEFVAEGLSNQEIAQRLFISRRTAETHVDHIKDKLGINTRAQLMAWIRDRERNR
jgi:DNA-binding CsgD family transcriptional regulator